MSRGRRHGRRSSPRQSRASRLARAGPPAPRGSPSDRGWGDRSRSAQASSGITQSGRCPAATRWILSKPFRKRAVQFSQVGPAVCGVKVTLGRAKSGWSLAGGSSLITSSPAPASRPVVSARWSAGSSTTGPRQVLMRTAPGRMRASSRDPIMPAGLGRREGRAGSPRPRCAGAPRAARSGRRGHPRRPR